MDHRERFYGDGENPFGMPRGWFSGALLERWRMNVLRVAARSREGRGPRPDPPYEPPPIDPAEDRAETPDLRGMVDYAADRRLWDAVEHLNKGGRGEAAHALRRWERSYRSTAERELFWAHRSQERRRFESFEPLGAPGADKHESAHDPEGTATYLDIADHLWNTDMPAVAEEARRRMAAYRERHLRRRYDAYARLQRLWGTPRYRPFARWRLRRAVLALSADEAADRVRFSLAGLTPPEISTGGGGRPPTRAEVARTATPVLADQVELHLHEKSTGEDARRRRFGGAPSVASADPRRPRFRRGRRNRGR
ncbi:hypothetical protein [Streptomonospora litoralis]|uniref:Uncharacterized protein n=1 Tax=Streptomonospora litoralis TaxID=2498135 RepID=A0A4P6Q6E4_9ACTN|nr:hypothetical protein [Streptomonospora litoralis]QBI56336.1 hypothetical protein EKD16_22915 [Streptomonospora litoralis]